MFSFSIQDVFIAHRRGLIWIPSPKYGLQTKATAKTAKICPKVDLIMFGNVENRRIFGYIIFAFSRPG